MNVEDRIVAFENLGKYLSAIDPNVLEDLIEKTRRENPWFTVESIKTAISGVSALLEGSRLRQWLSGYHMEPGSAHIVGVVMAGNIPLVGFHDLLSVLLSGNILLAKTSSKDNVLMRFVAERLVSLEPRFAGRIKFEDQLKNFDAVIATGSDNSARYFHYYFGKYPHIIRKNRTSVAILDGKESTSALTDLGKDVFTYFGLGCRNVSKVYVPQHYDFATLIAAWRPFEQVMMHHKYSNNYDYQKSILLLNRDHFIDSGFLLIRESEKLVSPISVLFYESYLDDGDLALKLVKDREKIQAVVGNKAPATVKFGSAQLPEVWDYADGVDTLKFLTELA